MDEKNAVQLAKVLLAQPEVKPCGLGTMTTLEVLLLLLLLFVLVKYFVFV